MSMNNFLIWVGETFAKRKKLIIADPCGLGPYLTRYYLLGNRKSRWALMLHHIHRSDQDRDMHDHPWPFWSLILTGGYWEITPANKLRPFGEWFQPWSLLRRPANWIHRVALDWPNPGPVWTLVLRGRYERIWGFHTSEGFVPYNEYDSESGCD